ncbi:MAG: hypothetical protein ACI4EL_05550 [Candidatus Fimimorpha sp.]
MEVIHTTSLCKKYRGKTAVDHINMSVEQGAIYGGFCAQSLAVSMLTRSKAAGIAAAIIIPGGLLVSIIEPLCNMFHYKKGAVMEIILIFLFGILVILLIYLYRIHKQLSTWSDQIEHTDIRSNQRLSTTIRTDTFCRSNSFD